MPRKKYKKEIESIPEHIKICSNCKLCKTRNNVVIGRGVIPADVLFLGEAPLPVDDLIGMPFLGTRAKFLTKMFSDSVEECQKSFPSYFITNTILCVPYSWDKKEKKNIYRSPKLEEILKCKKNVFKIIWTVKPKIICFIGKEAEKYYLNDLKSMSNYVIKRLNHPGFLAKSGGESSPYYGTNIRYLTEIIEKIERINLKK